MVALNFNVQEIDTTSEFDPVPPGQYLVAITKSTEKPTKAGNGHIIELELVILDGQYKNRRLWDRICIDHPNEQTRQIAQKTVACIANSVGVVARDTVQLHDLPLMASVAQQTNQSNGLIQNVIKRYYKRQDSAQTKTNNVVANNTSGQKPTWMQQGK